MGRMKSKSETNLENKLVNCHQKLEALNQENSNLRKENKQLRQTNQKSIKSKEHYKSRLKDSDGTKKDLLAELNREKQLKRKWGNIDFSDQEIDRHKYPEHIINLIHKFVMRGCSLRLSVEILAVVNEEFGLGLLEFPCFSSVRNWLSKLGFAVYNESLEDEYPDGYACILDESMMVGGQKLLLTLGVPASKILDKDLSNDSSVEFLVKKSLSSLTYGDIKVLDMSVASSWNGDSIGKVLEQVASKVGKAPSYVISDNASIMNKGIRDKNFIHIEDIGHSVSLAVERVYKTDEDFINFEKETASVKSSKVMCPVAYLLPPKMRTVARFMNLFSTVNWAFCMSQVLPNLDTGVRSVFSFLQKYKDLINSLQFLFVFVNIILKRMKECGLSKETIELSFIEIGKLQSSAFRNVRLVGDGLAKLFNGYREKLPNDPRVVWHCSSDIIESLFGYYKSIKSPNKMNGVTSRIFLLPLKTKTCSHKSSEMSFKKYLESNTLAEINQWTKKHLLPNQVVKRIKTLKKQNVK
jgi:hypothetical protein